MIQNVYVRYDLPPRESVGFMQGELYVKEEALFQLYPRYSLHGVFPPSLSSFNSVLNSVDTMFTMDIYKEFIDKDASEEKLVKIGKNVGIIFAVLTTIVGPLIYFFPAGLKTFLDSLVMLIALPVLTAVFGGFFFKHLPKYSAKVILVLHVGCYGSFLLFLNSKLHYLYAVFVLLTVELLVMFIFNQRYKAKHPEVWVQKDIGAGDLTPWKYRWVATALILICVAAVYLAKKKYF